MTDQFSPNSGRSWYLTAENQGFEGARLTVPRRQRDQPNSEFLEERYERFRTAG